MDILCLKLEQDLFKQLTEYCDLQGFPKDELTTIIKEHIDPELFKFKSPSLDETKCMARLWDRGTQCNHNCVDSSEYCQKHLDMIRYYGVLRFGNMREKKPKYDLIKLKHGKKERLFWIHPDPLIRLQNVLDKQQKKIIASTPKSIVR